jgi:hypothetical protein
MDKSLPGTSVAEPEPQGAETFGRSRNNVLAPAPGQTELVH